MLVDDDEFVRFSVQQSFFVLTKNITMEYITARLVKSNVVEKL